MSKCINQSRFERYAGVATQIFCPQMAQVPMYESNNGTSFLEQVNESLLEAEIGSSDQ